MASAKTKDPHVAQQDFTPRSTVPVDSNINQNVASLAIINAIASEDSKDIKSASLTVSQMASIVAAVPGKRIKVCSYFVSTDYTIADIGPKFLDGSSNGPVLCALSLRAEQGTTDSASLAVEAPSYLFGTSAGNALFFNPDGQSVSYSISYFTEDSE